MGLLAGAAGYRHRRRGVVLACGCVGSDLARITGHRAHSQLVRNARRNVHCVLAAASTERHLGPACDRSPDLAHGSKVFSYRPSVRTDPRPKPSSFGGPSPDHGGPTDSPATPERSLFTGS